MTTTTYREATPDDDRALYELFRDSLEDLLGRLGYRADAAVHAAERQRLWDHKYAALFAHLSRTGAAWVAEQDGRPIGYARATRRGELTELTELFVAPGQQAAGVGRELLARAFPADSGEPRVVVATLDPRAQARYLRAGLYPRFPIYALARRPEPVAVPAGLEAVPLAGTADELERVAAIDLAVLGHPRDPDIEWLIATRAGFLYRRDGVDLGYGFVGPSAGPFAVLAEADLPAVLTHAEAAAAAQGLDELSLDIPGPNRVALDHLLTRGFRVDSWIALLMSDVPFGGFERYVIASPTFFL